MTAAIVGPPVRLAWAREHGQSLMIGYRQLRYFTIAKTNSPTLNSVGIIRQSSNPLAARWQSLPEPMAGSDGRFRATERPLCRRLRSELKFGLNCGLSEFWKLSRESDSRTAVPENCLAPNSDLNFSIHNRGWPLGGELPCEGDLAASRRFDAFTGAGPIGGSALRAAKRSSDPG